MPTFSRKHIAIARSAGALDNVAFVAERTPEQATAFAALLAAFNGNADDAAACYAAASVADAVKPVRKPAADTPAYADAMRASAKAAKAEPKPERAAKPEKPSKPADESKASDYAARVALIGEHRATVGSIYNGPSLAVRSNPKRIPVAVYAELLRTPKHRTDLSRVSVRDESALFLILSRGTRSGGFDPVALNLDAGIFSRLASVAFIAADGDGFTLTKAAIVHARGVAKRAAA